MHQRDFFKDAARLLRKGGVFTYFCNQEEIIQDESRYVEGAWFL